MTGFGEKRPARALKSAPRHTAPSALQAQAAVGYAGFMRAVFIFIVLLLLGAIAVPATIAVRFWMDAGDVIARAEQSGALAPPPASGRLSWAEYTIAADEFSETWRTGAIPCRTLALLWADVSTPQGVSPAMPVSQKLAGALLSERQATSVRWQMRRFAVACRLEQRFDDRQILRAWLATASFGAGAEGLEAAAQAIFHKPSNALNPAESARLAVLLRAPGLRGQDERWAERAHAIEQRVAARAR